MGVQAYLNRFKILFKEGIDKFRAEEYHTYGRLAKTN